MDPAGSNAVHIDLGVRHHPAEGRVSNDLREKACIDPCEDGKIVITPDTERAAIAEAEQEFMDREMDALKKRFQKEKEQIHARFVAERKSVYGTGKEAADV